LAGRLEILKGNKMTVVIYMGPRFVQEWEKDFTKEERENLHAAFTEAEKLARETNGPAMHFDLPGSKVPVEHRHAAAKLVINRLREHSYVEDFLLAEGHIDQDFYDKARGDPASVEAKHTREYRLRWMRALSEEFKN
jgi:hypothetical protein